MGKPDDVAVKPLHMDALTNKLQELRETGNAVIFAADLNTGMDTPAYVKFAKDNVDAETAFLTSAYDLAEQNKQHRFTASKWRRGGDQKDKCKRVEQTIDFIFTSGMKAVATLSVPDSETVENDSELLLPCWRYPSDHFMIGADLEWSKEANTLLAGQTVTIEGLKNYPQHNGKKATTLKYIPEKGRWNVKLDGGKVIRVRPENLQLFDMTS